MVVADLQRTDSSLDAAGKLDSSDTESALPRYEELPEIIVHTCSAKRTSVYQSIPFFNTFNRGTQLRLMQSVL